MVILCRLPFRVPSEPVLKARMAAIEERGGNPFAELSLPDAVVRMRQGFGRLMRRQDDRGVVLVLDPRIVTKTYGSVFLQSLPGDPSFHCTGSRSPPLDEGLLRVKKRGKTPGRLSPFLS